MVRAADGAPDHGADDHEDGHGNDDHASARAIPRYARDDGLVALRRRRFVFAGVTHRTGVVAGRARIGLGGDNEKKMGRS